MKVYQNGSTYHLFPECRGVKGEEVEFEKGKICGVCERRYTQQVRANDMRLLIDNGFNHAEIGRQFGISRQAVWALVQEVA